MAVFRLAALLLLLAVAVAGCGEAAAPAAEPSAPAAAIATATPTPAGPHKAVDIVDFEYSPRALRIAPGTRVTWTDRDEANHSVTFKQGPGDLGNIRQGGTRSATFIHPGTYTYVCVYHPSMRGKVIVR